MINGFFWRVLALSMLLSLAHPSGVFGAEESSLTPQQRSPEELIQQIIDTSDSQQRNILLDDLFSCSPDEINSLSISYDSYIALFNILSDPKIQVPPVKIKLLWERFLQRQGYSTIVLQNKQVPLPLLSFIISRWDLLPHSFRNGLYVTLIEKSLSALDQHLPEILSQLDISSLLKFIENPQLSAIIAADNLSMDIFCSILYRISETAEFDVYLKSLNPELKLSKMDYIENLIGSQENLVFTSKLIDALISQDKIKLRSTITSYDFVKDKFNRFLCENPLSLSVATRLFSQQSAYFQSIFKAAVLDNLRMLNENTNNCNKSTNYTNFLRTIMLPHLDTDLMNEYLYNLIRIIYTNFIKYTTRDFDLNKVVGYNFRKNEATKENDSFMDLTTSPAKIITSEDNFSRYAEGTPYLTNVPVVQAKKIYLHNNIKLPIQYSIYIPPTPSNIVFIHVYGGQESVFSNGLQDIEKLLLSRGITIINLTLPDMVYTSFDQPATPKEVHEQLHQSIDQFFTILKTDPATISPDLLISADTKFFLYGHSYGGRTSVWQAQLHPGTFDGYISYQGSLSPILLEQPYTAAGKVPRLRYKEEEETKEWSFALNKVFMQNIADPILIYQNYDDPNVHTKSTFDWYKTALALGKDSYIRLYIDTIASSGHFPPEQLGALKRVASVFYTFMTDTTNFMNDPFLKDKHAWKNQKMDVYLDKYFVPSDPVDKFLSDAYRIYTNRPPPIMEK